MENKTSVKWTCNLRSDFTEDIIEYGKSHNPYTGYRIRCAYRDGIYVMKSKTKFKEYINQIADYFVNCQEKSVIVAQVLFELAKIRKEEKLNDESLLSLEKARQIMYRELALSFCDENLELIKKINGIYYSLNGSDYGLYDIYYLLGRSGKGLMLRVNDDTIEVKPDGRGLTANEMNFESVDSFIRDYCIGEESIRTFTESLEIKMMV